MLIVSHRGNLRGPDPEQENRPAAIAAALALAFEVEIDVWADAGRFFLGHDEPLSVVALQFLRQPGLWIHAKNIPAVEALAALDVHWFWHESDVCTLTSRGHVWAFPGNDIAGAIVVETGSPRPLGPVRGVCTDYPLQWRAAAAQRSHCPGPAEAAASPARLS